MKCPNCNTCIPDSSNFCIHCGQRTKEKSGMTLCNKCGKEIPSDSKFCPFCGESLPFYVQNQESVIIIHTEGNNCSISEQCGGDNSLRLKKGKNVISELSFPWIKNGFYIGNNDDTDKTEEIKSVDLSRYDSACVTNMCLMFSECSSIESIDFNNFDSLNVNDMNCCFQGCSSLKILNLSRFDTSNVIDMGQMFEGCSSLETLNLSNFNTNKVQNVDCMFEGCLSLKQVILKKCDYKTILMFAGAIAEAGISPEIITN